MTPTTAKLLADVDDVFDDACELATSKFSAAKSSRFAEKSEVRIEQDRINQLRSRVMAILKENGSYRSRVLRLIEKARKVIG